MNLKLISGVTLITLLSTVLEANEGVIRANSLTYPGSIMSIMNSVEPKKRICKSCGQQRIKHLDYQPVTPPRQKNKSEYLKNLDKTPHFEYALSPEFKTQFKKSQRIYQMDRKKNLSDNQLNYNKLRGKNLSDRLIFVDNNEISYNFLDCADINPDRTDTFFERYLGNPYLETIDFTNISINLNVSNNSIEYEENDSYPKCTKCKQNGTEQ